MMLQALRKEQEFCPSSCNCINLVKKSMPIDLELQTRITKELTDRKRYADSDFMRSEVLNWLAVLSGISTAICALSEANKFVTAGLGALPIALKSINNHFNFSKRSTWNKLYKIELQELLDDLTEDNSLIIRKRLTALETRKEKEWNSLKI